MNVTIDPVVLTPNISNFFIILIIILCITGILWAMWPQSFLSFFKKKKGEK